MADIKLTLGVDDSQLRKQIKTTSRILKRFEKIQKKMSRNRTINIRITNRDIENSEKTTANKIYNNERRLSRRRARNRLRDIRQRKREREREQREQIRDERRFQRRIQRIRNKRRRRDLAQRRKQARAARRTAKRAGIGLGLVGFGVAGAVAFQAREALEFERQLSMVAAQAGITTKKEQELAKAISFASLKFGKSKMDILEGIKATVSVAGDLELGTSLMDKFTQASIGMGANIEDLGVLSGVLKETLGASNKEVGEFLEILAVQGEAGSVELANLATQGRKLFGAAATFGIKGRRGLAELGAFIQAAGLTGQAEEASTFVVNFLSEVSQKSAKIKKNLGFDVRDQTGELKGILTILEGVTKAAKGKGLPLQQIFGRQAIKPILQIANKYKQATKESDRFKSLQSLVAAGVNATSIIQDRYNRVATTSAQKIDKIVAAYKHMLAVASAPIIERLTFHLERLTKNPERLERFADSLAKVAVNFAKVVDVGAFLFSTDYAAQRYAKQEIEYFNTPEGKSILMAKRRRDEEIGRESIKKYFREQRQQQQQVNVSNNIAVTVAEGQTKRTMSQTTINPDRGDSR